MNINKNGFKHVEFHVMLSFSQCFKLLIMFILSKVSKKCNYDVKYHKVIVYTRSPLNAIFGTGKYSHNVEFALSETFPFQTY